MIVLCLSLILVVSSYAQEDPVVKEIVGRNKLFRRATSLAIGFDNSIYVVDAGNSKVIALNESGNVLYESSQGGSDGELRWPVDVAISGSGGVYVVDAGNKRIVEYSRLLEWRGEFVIRDAAGEVLEPRMIASNIEGDLFIYENSNNQIIKYDRFFTAVGRIGGQVGGILTAPVSLDCISDDLYWIDDATQKAYTCDNNLSNARPWQAGFPSTDLYQLTGVGQTWFAVSDQGIVRTDQGNFSVVALEVIDIASQFAKDLRLEARSSNDLYILDSRSGRILLLHWP